MVEQCGDFFKCGLLQVKFFEMDGFKNLWCLYRFLYFCGIWYLVDL